MRSRPAQALLFLISLLGAVACQEETAGEFRVGLLAVDGDGYVASSGAPSIRGAELAVEEINEAGGIQLDGRPYFLRLVVRHYDPRPAEAVAQARMLFNRDSVHALVGPQLSWHAIPVAGIAESARVPMISPMSSNPATTAGRRFVFRLAFLDEVQGRVLAQYALDSLGARSAAFLYDESLPYGRDIAQRFREAFEAKGGTIVASETYTTDQAGSFLGQLSRIARAGPDVLLLPNPSQDDSIQVREARAMGISAAILGTDTWDINRMSSLPAAQGVVVTHQWHYLAANPETVNFLRRYREAYARDPRATAAMTYDAVRILAEAADAAGSLDPEWLRGSIASISNFEGATGNISFHGSQDPVRSAVLSRIENGETVILGMVDP